MITDRNAVLQLLLLAVSTATLGFTLSAPDAAKEPYAFLVRVGDDQGAPLAGAKLIVGDQVAGITDAQGEASLVAHETAQSSIELRVDCPKGYAGSKESIRIALPRAGQEPSIPAHEKHLVCTQEPRNAVLLVKTFGVTGLPIIVNGQFTTMTNVAGEAQLVYRIKPRSKLDVMLDTSGEPGIEPQNPMRSFTIAEDDAVLVFEQTFVSRNRRGTPRSCQAAQRLSPYRLN
jgi:hypothetical protein